MPSNSPKRSGPGGEFSTGRGTLGGGGGETATQLKQYQRGNIKMKGGDLSNQVVPRLVIIFEGALGFIAANDRKQFDRHIARKNWLEAVALWQINPMMASQIWYLTVHRSLTIDVVTFAGPKEFGEALAERLQDWEDLPVHQVWATRVELLARKIAYMTDLRCIYDPNPERWLTWGSKGRLITRPDEVGQ